MNLITKYIPVIGISIFAILYIYAASLYPGGSQVDLHSTSFDWVHNYWCDLTNETAQNGTPNAGSKSAIGAMLILCISLTVFFFRFANGFVQSKFWKLAIKVCGTFSMFFTMLIFTPLHNQMILLASIFGLVVLIGIIKEIIQSNLTFYKITGILCILLLASNNYIYYSKNFIEVLPLLQKVSFAVVLLWLGSLSLKTNKI